MEEKQEEQIQKPHVPRKWTPPKQTPDDTPIVKIAEAHFREATAAFQRYFIEVPANTTKEALLNPHSYSHVARKLGPMDELVIVAKDASFYSRFLVIYQDHLQAKVVCLEWKPLNAVEIESEDVRYFVKHFPNRDVRWAVVRKSDNHRMSQGFASREEAHAWIGKNQARMAAA